MTKDGLTDFMFVGFAVPAKLVLKALPRTFISKNTLLCSPYKVQHFVALEMSKEDTHVDFLCPPNF